MKYLILAFLVCAVISQTPPTWADRFQITFVESYATTQTRVIGKMLYEHERGLQKIERADGKYDMVCGSIMPNTTTACSHLIRDNKRYIVFPEKRTCCMCCDAAHGCGVLSRNWLKDAKYEGQQVLSGESFNKWSIIDGSFTDLFYSKKDQIQTPRRLVTAQSSIDYIMNSYSERQIPEVVFALPAYCNSTCPPSTVCGKFQGSLQQQ